MRAPSKPNKETEAPARLTKGCQTVLQVLGKGHHLASAQDIHGSLRDSLGRAPGLTTVYRSLESLVELGLVQAVDLGDGERRYEVVEPGEHHHHLVCQKCGGSVHLDQCFIDDLESSIRNKYGFETTSHVLEIFGVCRNCSSKR